MKFVIITHVQHIKIDNQYFGYAPYIREMNIWMKYVDEVIVVAPLIDSELNPIYEKYSHSNISFCEAAEFEITSLTNLIKTLIKLPEIFNSVYKAMSQADHIHLRCPGNMGLIGALVQILFPNKQKTAKYAGNWDPKSKQPWSYRLQKWILSNTFLTRNMQVLVYGEWPNQTKNIKPFFTATYSESEIQNSEFRIQNKWSLPAQSKTTENNFDFARLDKIEIDLPPTSFLFVGTLSKGKQPLYAIQLVEKLYQHGKKVQLNLYGDGILRPTLETYIKQNSLQDIVFLRGNQSKETVLKGYQNSHFLILPSKSEGWPKVVAEAMFWGCVPIASPVSCVPFMMGNGSRGVILQEELNQDVDQIEAVISKQEVYQKMASEGQTWSRQFTTDKFEAEIKKLLRG
ncbi:glycosyltransferase family 4 protein [Flavobacterium sasangense]|uniref:glycosyltransferase family 4 protein n=1 Tax=Flavobacterium sasangense TaxID=503361 RepID=UPI00047A88FC|nr:glycosyltransferase [Flavobacterium sasangense]